mmetsp:Transcript_9684/g.24044  ORF Transcript_9684/g.24044 Transcript_9684/m.24044 type:complete len:252 (-) Transcript_9684:748-1503(-)
MVQREAFAHKPAVRGRNVLALVLRRTPEDEGKKHGLLVAEVLEVHALEEGRERGVPHELGHKHAHAALDGLRAAQLVVQGLGRAISKAGGVRVARGPVRPHAWPVGVVGRPLQARGRCPPQAAAAIKHVGCVGVALVPNHGRAQLGRSGHGHVVGGRAKVRAVHARVERACVGAGRAARGLRGARVHGGGKPGHGQYVGARRQHGQPHGVQQRARADRRRANVLGVGDHAAPAPPARAVHRVRQLGKRAAG